MAFDPIRRFHFKVFLGPILHILGTYFFGVQGITKIDCHYFWPGLIAFPKNILPIEFVGLAYQGRGSQGPSSM
jgi:hypothetical protein